MKRRVLGSLVAVLLFPMLLLAEVKVSVDRGAVYRGDSVVYTITATGSDITFPELEMIDGAPIESRSSSKNVSIVNGDFQRTSSLSFRFTPKKSLTIPSYDVEVDGKIEQTKPITVKIVDPSQNKNSPVVVDINLSKTEAKVGEMVKFSLIFKHKPNVPIYKLDIEEPKFENFWVKEVDDVVEGVEGEYVTKTYTYLLFAQKSGTLEIPAITVNVGQLVQNRRRADPFFNSAFGQQIRYSKFFSNALSLEVTPLPNNLELYGNFQIKAEVDKKSVLANKPLNVTLSVMGIGNIDDVQKFELDLAGAVVYANEPTLQTKMDKEKYGGLFKQKIVIIADHSFSIPPFELKYFDALTQKEKTIQTDPIQIEVTGGSTPVVSATAKKSSSEVIPVEKKSVDVSQPMTRSSKVELLIAALVGFGVGALSIWLIMRDREESSEGKETPMAKQIKQTKGDKELFELLLAQKGYAPEVDVSLKLLEENLYFKANHKVDKKALMAVFSEKEAVVTLP